MSDWAASLIELPYLPALLLKATAVPAVAWLVHRALRGPNPQWRVLLWRGTLVALMLLPPAQWVLPRLDVALMDAPVPPPPPPRPIP